MIQFIYFNIKKYTKDYLQLLCTCNIKQRFIENIPILLINYSKT